MRLPAGHPLHLVLGLTVWFAWFGAIYGGAAVACAVAPPPAAQGPATWVNAGVLALTVVTTAGLAWAFWRTARSARRMPSGAPASRERFIANVAAGLYLTAAASTLVVGLPAVLVPPCV